MTGSAIARENAAAGEVRERRERRRMLEERLATDHAWRRDRREMATLLRDPALGLQLAAALAAELPWRLVAEAAQDARVAAGVRQVLDRGLARRVAALSPGERLALARIAEPETRRVLADAGDEKVLGALALHPRAGARERAQHRAQLVSVRVGSQPRRGGAETSS